MDFEQRLQELKQLARGSLCSKAKCAAVILKDGQTIGQGYNAPPLDNPDNPCRCLRKDELKPGFKSDTSGCVHAEQRAIMDALQNNPDKLSDSCIYYARFNHDLELEYAGKPYCTHCSKLALDAGITEFVLWHQNGPKAYPTDEYNELSFAYPG